MTDADLCHVVDGNEAVALCGANLGGHEWCKPPCRHEPCPVCLAVEQDEAEAATA